MPTTRVWLAFLLVSAGFFVALAARPSNADELVLRNLKVVRNCQIISVDVDGLRIDREIEGLGNPLSWDLVLRVSLAAPDAEKSAAIKEYSQSIGGPLARLKARLLAGDQMGLLQPAESLHAVVKGRPTPENLLALVGLMRSTIALGRREHAVPFAIEALRLQHAAKISFAVVPGKPPVVDSQTGLFEELPAIWLDADSAKEAWPAVEKQLEKQLDEQPIGGAANNNPDGVWLYGASLAVAAGEPKKAESLLAKMSDQESWARRLVQSELNLASDRAGQAAALLTTTDQQVPQASRYWLALVQASVAAKLAHPGDDNSALILELLRAPSLPSHDQPELAAGCLERAISLATIAGDSRTVQILKSELLRAFPQTVAAKRVGK